MASALTSMYNSLKGQPASYEKKAKYRFGETLGAGTYGVVRQAEGPTGKVAIKIILKKNVKGNEEMVKDEMDLLQSLQHQHIVSFHDWFESKDKYYIVTQLATGGELFDRICDRGKFTEKDAAETINQVLDAVNYLHERNIVHRDLKPENLLYLTPAPDSNLVLADFGIAKTLDDADEQLTTMAGSFGYAAPEVMQRKGHSKPVDMWSIGVITYTLLCGYSPFKSENVHDLIVECTQAQVTFHSRYWQNVSREAKDFILALLQVNPDKRLTSQAALEHPWVIGNVATDRDLLPEISKYVTRMRLLRGIRKARLASLLEELKLRDEDGAESETASDSATVPTISSPDRPATGSSLSATTGPDVMTRSRASSRANRTPLFSDVVLATLGNHRGQKTLKEMQTRTTSSNENKPSS